MARMMGDTSAPAHPQVIDALVRANEEGNAAPYGNDDATTVAREAFRALFGAPVELRWSLGGTGANILALSAVLERQQSVVCASTSHIVMHECGAVAQATGAQMWSVNAQHGKLTPDSVRPVLELASHPHSSKARVVSITNTTELGTVYTSDETRALADLAHEYDALLHVDGARIATACAALGTTAEQLLTLSGVDIVSFGGTKAGTAFGEAVIFIDPTLASDIHRKQIAVGQLSAKTRYVAAQFQALLHNDLWLVGARHANAMAQLLIKQVQGLPGVNLWPADANIVLLDLDEGLFERMTANGFFPFFPGTRVGRWVAAWNTTEEDVNAAADTIRAAAGTE